MCYAASVGYILSHHQWLWSFFKAFWVSWLCGHTVILACIKFRLSVARWFHWETKNAFLSQPNELVLQRNFFHPKWVILAPNGFAYGAKWSSFFLENDEFRLVSNWCYGIKSSSFTTAGVCFRSQTRLLWESNQHFSQPKMLLSNEMFAAEPNSQKPLAFKAKMGFFWNLISFF